MHDAAARISQRDDTNFMSQIDQQRIANELGISRATVSRCFTNHPGISPQTRASVFELAARLGYQHMAPRTPRRTGGEKSVAAQRTIGVLVCIDRSDFAHPDYQNPAEGLIAGVSEFAQLHRLKVHLDYVSPKVHAANAREDAALQQVMRQRKRPWAGVILIYPFHEDVVQEIARRYPVVSLVEQPGDQPLNCVDVHHSEGVSLVIDHLVALGHRRIGFYTRQYDVEASWSFRRYAGFVEKLARIGWPLVSRDVVNIGRTLGFEEGYDHVAGRVRDGVTAWVCAADHQAYDLVAALKSRGLCVPEQVSVTGFDGIRKPKGAPLLTTVEIPYREIGLTGGRRLLDLIRKPFESPHHILVSGRFRAGMTITSPCIVA